VGVGVGSELGLGRVGPTTTPILRLPRLNTLTLTLALALTLTLSLNVTVTVTMQKVDENNLAT